MMTVTRNLFKSIVIENFAKLLRDNNYMLLDTMYTDDDIETFSEFINNLATDFIINFLFQHNRYVFKEYVDDTVSFINVDTGDVIEFDESKVYL